MTNPIAYIKELSKKIDNISGGNGNKSITVLESVTGEDDIIQAPNNHYVGKYLYSNLDVSKDSEMYVIYTVKDLDGNTMNKSVKVDVWNTICDSIKVSSVKYHLSGYAVKCVAFEFGVL